MTFPKSRVLSAKRLSQLMKESTGNGARFCFILGSGASVESGIPSGNVLEMQWMDCLMGVKEDRGMPTMDAEETRRIANELCAEKAIAHKFEEIEDAWRYAKENGTSIPSKYYFDIYKLRFYTNPRNGYSYLEKIMEPCTPSLGYHTLAKLLTENNLNNLVITTNFVSLVEDALFLYTDKKPLVVGHESLADYMDANIQRPIVAKVHRGLMYAPFNSPETTQELKTEWQKALSYALNTYTPIVIGYAGGDHSLMSFLEDDATTIQNSIYWCYRGKIDFSSLPEENIQKFVAKRNGYFVAIDGFDALMVEIGKTMYGDAIRPGITAEHLKEKHDRRVQRYNEQWEKLNEKPEIQETLLEMNVAERREEEQREKMQELTAWDYIRRGIRANTEGRKEDALKECTKAIAIDPQSAAAYNTRGIVYDDLGQYEEAIRDYNKSIELDSSYAETYNNRGVTYKNLGQYRRAIGDYNKAIELDPSYAVAYNNRGVVYKEMKLTQKAFEDYNKAIELNPQYATAYKNRGDIYAKLKRYEKAIEDYTQSIQLNPKNKQAYLNRAYAYLAIGREELAEADKKIAEDL
ncbi:tetratricopeptide repeat protein [Pseudoflavonifractor sp. 60]|uniref:tetratricopeptide repeat protein n=1 Tax=Pseudoflavonifractor sp. 60 TaxID=2304576 RepID=UPI00136A033E|nr:tetratricopeptide repeat protein [Pseudoflavonifractor sp. 60]NBI67899.1 tetratricopeptide repeat protein [Pseudoflavonifractor sp. 60]